MTGRVDNVIISGGVNVSLDRVEAVVRERPGLASAVVVATADERWGQASAVVVEIAALAEIGADESALLSEIRDTVGDRLGKPARPARVVPVERMPVLASGKPDRAALRRMLAI